MSMNKHVLRPTALSLALSLIATSLPLSAAAPKRQPAVKASTPVTLNFVNTDIEAVTRAMSAALGKPILVDPRVKGTITLSAEQPVPVHEAYLTYLAALRGLGFVVIESNGLLKLIPEAEAKLQASQVTIGDARQRGDQVLTQIFKLNHENASSLVPVLRPLITPNNMINANGSNNSLVITDYAENLQRIGRIIAAMDQPSATDIEVIPLRHAVASDVAQLVQKLSEGSTGSAAQPGAAAAAGGGSGNVLADVRNNSIIVRATNPARLASLRAMIAKLDQPGLDGGSGSNIRVIYLKNADATKLATVLRAAFGGSGGSSGTGGSTSGNSSFAGTSSGSGSQSFAGTGSTSGSNTGTSGSSGSASTQVSASASPSTGGFVQADPATNSLVISAPEPLYRQIRAVVDQLDTRRAQIYVEALIVKVDASKVGQFGVQWQQLFGSKGDSVLSGLGTNFGSGYSNILNLSGAVATGRTGAAAALEAGTVPKGLNLGFLKKVGDFYTLGAIANFLEQQTGTNVLSTPNLVVMDNEEADLVIGQNVPFVTGQYTNTGSSSSGSSVSPFQTIDRKDVGLRLKIKGQVGEGGTVRMKVYQENSAVVQGATTSSGPTLDKSAVETMVTLEDGQVLVLGGLLKDDYTDNEDKVPGLGSIPLLGALFKSEGRKRQKTNLMIFLRPVIVRAAEGSDLVTQDRYDAIRAYQQGVQPQKNIMLPDTGAPLLPETPASAAGPRPLPATPPQAVPPASAARQ